MGAQLIAYCVLSSLCLPQTLALILAELSFALTLSNLSQWSLRCVCVALSFPLRYRMIDSLSSHFDSLSEHPLASYPLSLSQCVFDYLAIVRGFYNKRCIL